MQCRDCTQVAAHTGRGSSPALCPAGAEAPRAERPVGQLCLCTSRRASASPHRACVSLACQGTMWQLGC